MGSKESLEFIKFLDSWTFDPFYTKEQVSAFIDFTKTAIKHRDILKARIAEISTEYIVLSEENRVLKAKVPSVEQIADVLAEVATDGHCLFADLTETSRNHTLAQAEAIHSLQTEK